MRIADAGVMKAASCLLLLSLLAGCGGTESSLLDSSNDADASTHDGSEKGDASACIKPTAGETCTLSENACPQNNCCEGFSWSCSDGKWTKALLGCPCHVSS